MNDDKILPIDKAPQTAPSLNREQLAMLNQALLHARLAESQVGEMAARLELARIKARQIAEAFVALRSNISAQTGFGLGETHGWNEQTGEIVAAREMADH